jgi:hypothetical protein
MSHPARGPAGNAGIDGKTNAGSARRPATDQSSAPAEGAAA